MKAIKLSYYLYYPESCYTISNADGSVKKYGPLMMDTYGQVTGIREASENKMLWSHWHASNELTRICQLLVWCGHTMQVAGSSDWTCQLARLLATCNQAFDPEGRKLDITKWNLEKKLSD